MSIENKPWMPRKLGAGGIQQSVRPWQLTPKTTEDGGPGFKVIEGTINGIIASNYLDTLAKPDTTEAIALVIEVTAVDGMVGSFIYKLEAFSEVEKYAFVAQEGFPPNSFSFPVTLWLNGRSSELYSGAISLDAKEAYRLNDSESTKFFYRWKVTDSVLKYSN